MRSIPLLLTLLACNRSSDVVEDTSVVDDTGGEDTGEPDDTGDTDESDWWDEAWPYRVPVRLTSTESLDGVPQTVPVDFGTLLDGTGDDSGLDVDSLRIVVPTETDPMVFPAQFLDGWTGLLTGDVAASATGDQHGDVVFVPDGVDGVELDGWLYFGTAASSPSDALSVSPAASATADPWTLASGAVDVALDPDRGGLLASMTHDGVNLTSQADSSYGNGINGASPPNGWQITAADDAGTVELLADGPLIAGVRASGSRSNDQAGYDYIYEYWVVAGRPEVWMRTSMVTTMASVEPHNDDFTRGIRPWQSRQDAIVDGTDVARAIATDLTWTAVSSSVGGVGFVWVDAPRFFGRTVNSSDVGAGQAHYFLWFEANDYMGAGSGTPNTIPDETVLEDNRLMAIAPLDDASGAEVALAPLAAEVEVVLGALEQAE